MTTHILKGRSIDGTQYKTEFGWSSSIFDAARWTAAEAEDQLFVQEAKNATVEPDLKIGRLEVIEIPEKVVNRDRMRLYLIEGNSKEELADLFMEMLYEHDRKAYDELITDIDEQENEV